MRFLTFAVSLFAALAAAATTENGANAFIAPTSGASFAAGKTTTLEWTPTTSGTVSLRLQWGALTTATEGVVIASGIDNTGSYSWSVPANIPVEADYFIRIAADNDPSEVNYSARFAITGVTGASTTAATTVVSSTTSVASSTSTSPSSTTTLITTTTTSTSTSTSTTPSTTLVSSTSAVKTSATTSSPATSSTTSSAAATATTSVPHTNGVESVKVPGFLMCAVALGAFALL